MMSISLVLVVAVTILVLLGGLAFRGDPDADPVLLGTADGDTGEDVPEDPVQDPAAPPVAEDRQEEGHLSDKGVGRIREPVLYARDEKQASALTPPAPSAPAILGGDEDARDWPPPTTEELSYANGPRYYEPDAGAEMTLTIEALGIYRIPVLSSAEPGALNRGLVHEAATDLPWDNSHQKNVFIAGHRIGWPGTPSRLAFVHLNDLSRGDEVLLEDRQGRAYRYRVSESFIVRPVASWAMGEVRGRDTVTLMTCTPYPTFENRLIVRADRNDS